MAEKDVALLFVENHNFEERLLSIETGLSVQSSDVLETQTDRETLENVAFIDNGLGDLAGAPAQMDEVVEDIYTGDSQLANFLSRPVKIRQYVVPLGESFNNRTFYPWKDFLDNAAIKKKLDYFAYLQGNLHVKAVINATPFIYGEYALSYRPMYNFGRQFDVISTTDSVEAVGLTQRPTIYLESHKNKGGELHLPFFWYKNWLELKSSDATNMGELKLYPLADFRSANGLSLTPPTITIYAWMTDVKLEANTSRLAVQSRDEYGMGPVSRVASAMAGVTRRIEDVPVIGKFAKATTIGASAIAGIASLFGFTNVPVIDDVSPVKNTIFHALASSEIGVPLDKLTLDPKNELTIDNSVCGAPADDELSIVTFGKREAWIAGAEWAQSDAADTELFAANVTPTHCRTQGTGNSTRYLEIPAGLAARLFSNWRGDMVYRIKIVKSQYHQGRLLLTFDPTGTALLTSSPETVVYSEIVDVSTTDEVVVRIPYMAPQSFLRINPGVSRDIAWKGVANSTYYDDYHNGVFRVTVLNPLTGPDATSGVKINVFAYCDNLELANPSDVAYSSSLFAVQSADGGDSLVNVTLGVATSSPKELYAVNFGEDIRSLRSVMRRQSLVGAATSYINWNNSTTDVAGAIFNFWYGIYPPAYGYDPNGRETLTKLVGTGTTKANCVADSPSTIVSSCFVGVRGSYNYSINPIGAFDGEVAVMRDNEPHTSLVEVSANYMLTLMRKPDRITGHCGMAVTNTATQRSLQFSMPFMNKFRFMDTSPSQRNYGVNEDDSQNCNFKVTGTYAHDSPGAATKTFQHAHKIYGGIGVDYSPVFFLQVPWRHLYALPAS